MFNYDDFGDDVDEWTARLIMMILVMMLMSGQLC